MSDGSAAPVIPLGWEEIAALGLGELRGAPADGVVRAIHDDSRIAGPGHLFVALNTGTRFVEGALASGAAALVPDDQEAALAALATLVRGRSDAQVVAVVGSTGKTTTKDVLGTLCAAVTPTVAAEGSRNNELGLPLTVLRLEAETRVLVTEMGMRGVGQVAELCRIARPTLTLVTSIGPEHLEVVGTVADVARANAEAIEALPPEGIAVVPADEPLLEQYLRGNVRVRRFDPTALERIPLDESLTLSGRSHWSRWLFPLAGRRLPFVLPFSHRHLVHNVLAALTAYDALGLPLDPVQGSLLRVSFSAWRGEVHALPAGGLVVNDAYNANPTSMRAALLDLTERAEGRRRVAILGEMAELGAESGRYHDEIGALLAELGIEVVVAVGAPAQAYLSGAREGHAAKDGSVVADLLDVLAPGDAILVKASRSVGLEGIPALIEKHAQAW